jgi:hypothetical protein
MIVDWLALSDWLESRHHCGGDGLNGRVLGPTFNTKSRSK